MDALKLIIEDWRLSAGIPSSMTVTSSRFLSPLAINLTKATRVVFVTSLSIGLYSKEKNECLYIYYIEYLKIRFTDQLLRVNLKALISSINNLSTQTRLFTTRNRRSGGSNGITNNGVLPDDGIPIFLAVVRTLKIVRWKSCIRVVIIYPLLAPPIAFAIELNTSFTSTEPFTASDTKPSTMPIWKSFRIRRSIILPFLPATNNNNEWLI